MKLFYTLLFFLCFGGALNARTYSILEFGGEADGKTINTQALQNAINACTPGDTVLIPTGRYVTGTVHLKSNITLLIHKEGFLISNPDLHDHESYVTIRGTRIYYGIFNTQKANNITIAGNGTIEGNGPLFSDHIRTVLLDTLLTRYTRQKNNFRNPANVANKEVIVALEHPQHLITFMDCQNIRIQNIALLNAPGRAVYLAGCTNVDLESLKIWNNSANLYDAVGIQASDTQRLTINGCDIRSGNDAIALTGFDPVWSAAPIDSSRVHHTDSITISNCNLRSSANGISITSVNRSSVKNLLVANINITDSGRGIGLILRGEGSLENMAFNDLYIASRLHTGNWAGNGEPIHLSAVPGKVGITLGSIKNITFSNVACTAENHILIHGSRESLIQDVRFDDVVLKLKNSQLNEVAGGNIDLRGNTDPQQNIFASNIPAVMAKYVSGLFINNIKVTWGEGLTQPYFTDGIEVSNFKSFKLTHYTVRPAPSNVNAHAVSLIDGVFSVVDPGDIKRVRVTEPKPVKTSAPALKKRSPKKPL